MCSSKVRVSIFHHTHRYSDQRSQEKRIKGLSNHMSLTKVRSVQPRRVHVLYLWYPGATVHYPSISKKLTFFIARALVVSCINIITQSLLLSLTIHLCIDASRMFVRQRICPWASYPCLVTVETTYTSRHWNTLTIPSSSMFSLIAYVFY